MRILERAFVEYIRFVRWGLLLLVLMAAVRFAVGLSGVPYEKATHWVSLTILNMLLAVYFGHRASRTRFGGHRQLLVLAAVLALVMYALIIGGILISAAWDLPSYFHAPGHGFAPAPMTVGQHVGGQLLAMPLTAALLFVLASISFGVSSRLRGA